MANRVDGLEVKAIINTELESDEVEFFITPANLLVTHYLTDLVSRGLATAEMSDDLLKEIERWLSAHFVAVRDPQLKEERVGDATNVYNSPDIYDAKDLTSTFYGQQALILDYTGLLKGAGRKKTQLKALGTTYDADVDTE